MKTRLGLAALIVMFSLPLAAQAQTSTGAATGQPADAERQQIIDRIL